MMQNLAFFVTFENTQSQKQLNKKRECATLPNTSRVTFESTSLEGKSMMPNTFCVNAFISESADITFFITCIPFTPKKPTNNDLKIILHHQSPSNLIGNAHLP